MIGLIQVVEKASVDVENTRISSIGKGLLLLLGVEPCDGESEIEKMAKKIANLRIFQDANGKTNLSLLDVQGELLVVSQFTLLASLEKGNRPSFTGAGTAQRSLEIFDGFVSYFEQNYTTCKAGKFGADMKVSLVNDGPATYYLKVNS